jgi:Ca2+-binding EF-hand superfamily protein
MANTISTLALSVMLAVSSTSYAEEGPSDQDVFNMIDMDSDGKVSKQELYQFMTSYVDATITIDAVNDKVKGADKDGDGQLNIIEIKEI